MFFKKATTGENNLVWYIIGVLAVIFGYMIGQFPLLGVQWYQLDSDKSISSEDVEKFYETMDFSLLNIDKNIGLVLMITVFLFALLALMLVVKNFHKRPFNYLITPNYTINYRKIFFGFGLWFVLGLAFEGISAFLNPEVYYFNFQPLKWIILMVICVLLLPIQTSFEELFFRGYLMPALALVAKNKWIPLVITSILFGIIHGMNPEVEKYGFWTMQLYYVGAGLFLGLITILDDSLELALGVHAATNMFSAAFFSYDGSVLQTDTLVKTTEINPYIMIAAFMFSAIVFMLICNKKYGWNGFERLFQPISKGEKTISKADMFDSLDSDQSPN